MSFSGELDSRAHGLQGAVVELPPAGTDALPFGDAVAYGRILRRGLKSRPPKELASPKLTLRAIAIMAQEGCTSPVVASGTPTSLKKNASDKVWTVFR